MVKKYKVCAKCNLKKKLVNFTIDRSQSDGLDSNCRECKVLKNKERVRKRGKMYLDCKVGFNSSDADLYIVHKCEICEDDFFPIRSNHKRCDTCSYVARDIVHHSLSGERKYNKGFKREVVPAALIEVSKRYVAASTCCYCERAFTLDNPKSIDHIIPVCKQGPNESSNINICCLECNKSKAHLSLPSWINLCKQVALVSERTNCHGSLD